MILADPWFYAIAVPAVIISGISKAGFGGAIGGLAVPMMALVISAPAAVAIMLPILLVMDAVSLVAFRGKVDAAVLKWAIPAGLVGTLAGWWLFRELDDRWIRGLIGVESILFALHRIFQGAAAWEGAARPLRALPAGLWSALAGFTSFVSHAGGPPMMQLMLPLKLHREIFVGTLAWFFAAINASKILPYAQLGLLDLTHLGTSLVLLPVVPAGYWLGLKLLRSVQPATFVKLANWGLLATGVKLAWDAVR